MFEQSVTWTVVFAMAETPSSRLANSPEASEESPPDPPHFAADSPAPQGHIFSFLIQK